jgi:glycosyltransferase involved in cell wall biosynthesis
MKILFVNSIQMYGGGEVWMLRTLQYLSDRGHSVQLCCRPGTELYRRANKKGLRTLTMPFRGDFDPFTIFLFYRLLVREKIDIVLTNMDKELRIAGIAAWLTNYTMVIPRRGIDYPLKNKIQYRLSYTKLACAVIANSNSTKGALLKNAPWLDANSVQVIYNGIDPEPFLSPPRYEFRKQLKLKTTDVLIGFVGQLDERKGIVTLLHAFRMLCKARKDIHLALIGSGPMQDFISEYAVENGLGHNIHLPGFQEDIPDVMQSIDMLVLPSWWEGFGIVLIEAMAAGKPCVTTAVSSMPEIVIDQKTGRVVPVKDSVSLFAALHQLIHNPRLAAEMGKNGCQRVCHTFHIDTMIDQLESLFLQQFKNQRGIRRH